jgi:hypothetical protein
MRMAAALVSCVLTQLVGGLSWHYKAAIRLNGPDALSPAFPLSAMLRVTTWNNCGPTPQMRVQGDSWNRQVGGNVSTVV